MLAALKVLLAVAFVGAVLPSGPQTRTGGLNPVPQAFTGASAAISPGSAWNIYDSAPELAADALLAAKDGTAPQRVEHAETRAAEARAGNAHRQVGDSNRVLREGRVFRDTDTGNTVHMNGDRVAITSPDGARVITQFRNTRANTQARIQVEDGSRLVRMSEQLHYRRHDVFRKDASGEVVIYRCFEVLPRGGYVVQSADRVRLPLERSLMEQHERQLLELFCEMEPRMRGELCPTVEEAIASFDKAFSDIDEGNEL